MVNEKKPTPRTDTSLINAQAFGQRLSVSRRQIFRLNTSGKIPASIKVGGSVRWVSGEVSAWIEAGCPARDIWAQIKSSSDRLEV